MTPPRQYRISYVPGGVAMHDALALKTQVCASGDVLPSLPETVQQFIRIAFTMKEERLLEALRRIEKFMQNF